MSTLLVSGNLYIDEANFSSFRHHGRGKTRKLRTKVATVIKGHDKSSQDVSTVTGVQSQCNVLIRPSPSQCEAKMNIFGIYLDIAAANDTSKRDIGCYLVIQN